METSSLIISFIEYQLWMKLNRNIVMGKIISEPKYMHIVNVSACVYEPDSKKITKEIWVITLSYICLNNDNHVLIS